MKYLTVSILALLLIIIIYVIVHCLTKYIQKHFFDTLTANKESSVYPFVNKLINLIPNNLDSRTKRFLYFQYKYNFPLITMFAKYLKELNYNYCFVSRDCYFLYKLYNLLYPNNLSVYFHSSRTAFEKGSPSFVEYTKYYIKKGYV